MIATGNSRNSNVRCLWMVPEMEPCALGLLASPDLDRSVVRKAEGPWMAP